MFADVTLRAGDADIAAHRCILSSWSPVFRKMFTNGFLETSEQPIVRMDDMDECTLRLFLRLIYSGGCDLPQNYLLSHGLQLLTLANKYNILELVHALDRNLAAVAAESGDLQLAFDGLHVAAAHGAVQLAAWCKEKIHECSGEEACLDKIKEMVMSESFHKRILALDVVEFVFKRASQKQKP
ncbi:hypothetical protein CLOM_g4211 [Closterium sp. NIES-68]|nr:hypothetical protein CLOM_g4211 [Closterium sp. NIES-68]